MSKPSIALRTRRTDRLRPMAFSLPSHRRARDPGETVPAAVRAQTPEDYLRCLAIYYRKQQIRDQLLDMPVLSGHDNIGGRLQSYRSERLPGLRTLPVPP